jgi:hypothetical protein
MSWFAGQQVLLMSALTPGSGYGQDGIALAALLEEAGAVVHLDPSAVGVPLPLPVAKMLARPRPQHFDLVLQHADPATLRMSVQFANQVGRAVAWTMWEFGSLGREAWLDTLHLRLAGFDDVIGYTGLTTSLMAEHHHARSGTLLGGYSADLWKPRDSDPQRDWGGAFRYGMVITNLRKNWPAAVEAYLTLREEHPDFDAELHLKTNELLVPPYIADDKARIVLHHASWTHTQMREFYCGLNVLLCPSWGEGKSLPPMEAGTLGCPSILSECAGHTDWATDDIAWLVGGGVGEHAGMTYCKVDAAALADVMWAAYIDRGTARLKGERAAQMIPMMLDWPGVVQRLGFHLEAASARARPLRLAEAGASADT